VTDPTAAPTPDSPEKCVGRAIWVDDNSLSVQEGWRITDLVLEALRYHGYHLVRDDECVVDGTLARLVELTVPGVAIDSVHYVLDDAIQLLADGAPLYRLEAIQ
jgi:hypothetical protein